MGKASMAALFIVVAQLCTALGTRNTPTTLPPGCHRGLQSDKLATCAAFTGTTLNLAQYGIRTIGAGAFDGLTSLTELDLQGNQLTTLPPGIFDSLSSLTVLDLNDNQLTSLPPSILDHLTSLTALGLSSNHLTNLLPGVFNSLTRLTQLGLNRNQLTTLPPGVFDSLTSLTVLVLSSNQLAALPPGIFDSLTRLTELGLSSNQLITLPPGIFDSLTSLTVLDLYSNQLTTLPPGTFNSLTSLTQLDLYSNQLTTLPPGIFDSLTSLSVLDLHSNQLTTLLPGTFSSLKSLTVLGLRGNQLTTLPGSIFDSLTSLTGLGLSNNQLTTLPPGIFDSLTSLTQLVLYSNQMTSLPLGIFDTLTRLAQLDLSSNQLITLPPDILDKLTSLTELVLDSNQLTALPPGILYRLTSLTALDLHSNQLTTLPPGIFDSLTSLTQLYLGTNQLPALRPGSFDNLTSLTYLALPNNQLTALPPGIFNSLTSLTGLGLHGNLLTTLLPGTFNPTMKLKQLLLGGNQLGGSIPSEVMSLMNLEVLDLSSNRLSGTIPSSIATSSTLSVLDLRSNRLTGSLPLSALQAAQNLRIEHNFLSGPLLLQANAPCGLQVLRAEGNSFTGPLPSHLCTCPLRLLDVSGNSLSSIPTCVRGMHALQALMLGDNSFTGPLPPMPQPCALQLLNASFNTAMSSHGVPDVSGCSALQVLDARRSGLSGNLSLPWASLPSLNTVLLSDNALTGALPEPLAALPALSTLTLHGNKLTGTLPRVWSTSLQAVTLALNQGLYGSVPASLLRCPALKVLIASSMSLNGRLAAATNTSLEQLVLAANKLTGPLPSWLGDVAAVDVSRNLMSGGITWPVVNASSLDVSFNRLSGSLYDIAVVHHEGEADASVLEGNLWSCPVGEQWGVDPTYSEYECTGIGGHTTLLIATCAMAVTGVIVAAAGCWQLQRPPQVRIQQANDVRDVVQACLKACLLLGLVTFCACVVYGWMPTFYTDRFMVTWSAVGVGDSTWSGQGVVLAVLPAVTVASLAWLYQHSAFESSSRSAYVPAPLAQRAGWLVALLLASAVPNSAFVVLSPLASRPVQRLLKALLAVYKTMLNSWLAPRVARSVVGDSRLAMVARLRVSVILQNLNSVVVPLAASLLLHDSCLRYVLFGTPPSTTVHATAASPMFSLQCVGVTLPLAACGQICEDAGGHCSLVHSPGHISVDIDVPAPRGWSPTCPSSFLRQYGDVFVVSVLLQGMGWCVANWLRPRAAKIVRCGGKKGCIAKLRRRVFRVTPRPKLVASAYLHAANVVELAAVFGLWYPMITGAALVSLGMMRGMVAALVNEAGEGDERVVAPGVPQAVLWLSVFGLGIVSVLMLSGGSVYPESGWWVGVVSCVTVWVLGGGLLMVLGGRRKQPGTNQRALQMHALNSPVYSALE